MTPLDRAMELYKLMPKAQMCIISPCGHSPVLEHPMRFVAAVDSFVEELTPGVIEKTVAADLQERRRSRLTLLQLHIETHDVAAIDADAGKDETSVVVNGRAMHDGHRCIERD